MAIQHVSINDPNIHEPKGVSTAAGGTSYIANGVGSGVWRKFTPSELEGNSAQYNQTNQKLVSSGTGGITSVPDAAYGVMAITNNVNAFAVGAAADSTLNTNSDYVLFTGTGAPWASETLYQLTFNTDRLIVPYNGVYRLDMWSDITGFPNNMAKVGIKFRINGTTMSPRKVQVKSNSAGDSGNPNGFGILTLNANDYVQIMVASSHAGNLTFNSLNITISLMRAT